MKNKKNLCGSCDKCCTHFRIDKKFLSWRKTDKEKGETCDKLVNGRCARYKQRPKPCKDFECGWLQFSKQGIAKTEWSPDKIGFIVKLGYTDGRSAFMIEELEQGSLDFHNITPEQDEFLKLLFDLRENSNSLLLIRPFGHDKQYPLRH